MTISYIEHGSLDVILAVVALLVFAALLLSGLAMLYLSRTTRGAISAWVILSLAMIAPASIYFAMNNLNDADAILARQSEQIGDAYGLDSFTPYFYEPLCSNGNSDESLHTEATWGDNYGTIVVGARQGDSCEVSVFEENGKKLETVK